MKRLVTFAFLFGMAASLQAETTLTLREAVALAGQERKARLPAGFEADIAALRKRRLPNVRAEAVANASRTLDLFSEGPLEVRYLSSALAFDYPLWDGGASAARSAAIEARLQRMLTPRPLDQDHFAQLLESFAALYLSQQQEAVLVPLHEELTEGARRADVLLEAGDITNLAAAERREIALAFATQLHDLRARRVEAAARLRLLTGIEAEPVILIDLADPSRDTPASPVLSDGQVEAAAVALEESRSRLRTATAGTGLQALLSGFVGVGSAASQLRDVSSHGSFGIYGLRVHLNYPLLGRTNAVSVAEARADLQQNLERHQAILDASAERSAAYRLQEESSRHRAATLRQGIAIAREREESLRRLVAAGLRTETELAQLRIDATRRETEVLAAEVESWKARQLLAGSGSEAAPDRP